MLNQSQYHLETTSLHTSWDFTKIMVALLNHGITLSQTMKSVKLSLECHMTPRLFLQQLNQCCADVMGKLHWKQMKMLVCSSILQTHLVWWISGATLFNTLPSCKTKFLFCSIFFNSRSQLNCKEAEGGLWAMMENWILISWLVIECFQDRQY